MVSSFHADTGTHPRAAHVMAEAGVGGVWPRAGGREQGVFSLHSNGLAEGLPPAPITPRSVSRDPAT